MTNYSNFEDQELIQHLQGGDERIFIEIYNRYWDKMLVVAFNRLGNLQEAEECVQDVLYKFWKLHKDLLLTKDNLSNYLARAIRNQSINILAKRHRERTKAEEYIFPDNVITLTPEADLILRELQQQFENSIKALPSQCQLVFTLSREEGLTRKQISEKLNISENTVKSHLKKANKDLRDNTEFLTVLLFTFLYFQQ